MLSLTKYSIELKLKAGVFSGDMSFIPPEHNRELAEEGHKLITNIIKEKYSKIYPSDVVDHICNYLTTDNMLSHIATHLGMKDLVQSIVNELSLQLDHFIQFKVVGIPSRD